MVNGLADALKMIAESKKLLFPFLLLKPELQRTQKLLLPQFPIFLDTTDGVLSFLHLLGGTPLIRHDYCQN